MITEIKDTNLIAVEVPADAEDYRILNNILLNFKSVDTNLIFLRRKCNKFLGEVTKDEIGFDVSKLPEMALTTQEAKNILGKNDKINFYKLLAANGIYFENPIKVEGVHIAATIHALLKEWQSYEDRIVKGKLLIIEKKK